MLEDFTKEELIKSKEPDCKNLLFIIFFISFIQKMLNCSTKN